MIQREPLLTSRLFWWQLDIIRVMLPLAVIVLAAWMIQYSRLTQGAAWHDPIGKTLLLETVIILTYLIPEAGGIWVTYNRTQAAAAGLIELAATIALVALFAWRIWVWRRTARRGQ